jgi:hypothetical protein
MIRCCILCAGACVDEAVSHPQGVSAAARCACAQPRCSDLPLNPALHARLPAGTGQVNSLQVGKAALQHAAREHRKKNKKVVMPLETWRSQASAAGRPAPCQAARSHCLVERWPQRRVNATHCVYTCCVCRHLGCCTTARAALPPAAGVLGVMLLLTSAAQLATA